MFWKQSCLALLVAWSLFAMCAVASEPTPPAPDANGGVQRPNLILLYTDDQRFDGVGANENEIIRTPNLDRLMARSVRFTNAAVVMSLCSPSRAAALTGRYGSGNGVTGLAQRLAEGEMTFAHLLKRSGYRTAMVGKWHLGDRVPDAGFDFRCYFQGNGTYFGRKVWDNTRQVTPTEHVDAYCVRRSIAFLEEAARSPEPFVLFHATQLPHMDHRHSWPSEPEHRGLYDDGKMPLPTTWQGDLAGKPPYLAEVRNRTQAMKYGYDRPEAIRAHVGDYYGVITEMDSVLGELFDALTRLSLWNNTWIIFMSDNGWLLGEHGMTSKVLPYAPSVRVPMCVYGPGLKPRVEDRIALNIDIAPTLLDLAGVAVSQRMHGRSLLPVLEQRPVVWRDTFVYECLGGYGGTRPMLGACDARWKLIHTWDEPADAGRLPPAFVELYDLEKDPDERVNLADSPEASRARRRLGRVIDEHVTTVLSDNAKGD